MAGNPSKEVPHQGLAIYVDGENFSWLRARHLQAITQELASQFGPVVWVRLYTNTQQAPALQGPMSAAGFEVVPVNVHSMTVDEALMGDARREMSRLPQTVAIVSSDGDFAAMVLDLARHGRKPVVVANSYGASRHLLQLTQAVGGVTYFVSRLGPDKLCMYTCTTCSHGNAHSSTRPISLTWEVSSPSSTSTKSAKRRSTEAVHTGTSRNQQPGPFISGTKPNAPAKGRRTASRLTANHLDKNDPPQFLNLEQVASLKARQPWHSESSEKTPVLAMFQFAQALERSVSPARPRRARRALLAQRRST